MVAGRFSACRWKKKKRLATAMATPPKMGIQTGEILERFGVLSGNILSGRKIFGQGSIFSVCSSVDTAFLSSSSTTSSTPSNVTPSFSRIDSK